MRVVELMSGSVVTIPATASGREALEIMCARRVRHLPVVDARGTLVGIVTDRDLRHHLFTPGVFPRIGTVPVGRLLNAVAVREIMSVPVVTVAPDASLEDAAAVMARNRVGSVPVVVDGAVVGILTETDLLSRIIGEDIAVVEGIISA